MANVLEGVNAYEAGPAFEVANTFDGANAYETVNAFEAATPVLEAPVDENATSEMDGLNTNEAMNEATPAGGCSTQKPRNKGHNLASILETSRHSGSLEATFVATLVIDI